jgi:hypothetical protein
VFDADEGGEGIVASEFTEAGFDGDVAQDDGEEKGPPEDGDGIVIATVSTMIAKGLEQFVIGDGLEGFADVGESGVVFEAIPGEERFGGVEDQGGTCA